MVLDLRLYLDYNATAPLLDVARVALVEALEIFGNPSSVHEEGRKARTLIQEARHAVADLVQAKAENVIFTSGASESAATLLTQHYFLGRAPLVMSHLYVGATEHPCVAAGGSFPPEQISVIPVHTNGLINADALQEMMATHDQSQGLPLVAIQYANHETGIIQPMAELSALVKQAGGILIVDAVQAVGKTALTFDKTYSDFIMISGHKIGAPKGIGAFISSGSLLMPKPLIAGGGQQRGHRAGTENTALIAAFAAAARFFQYHVDEPARLLALREDLEIGLKRVAPHVTIYGEDVARLVNCCFFALPNMKAETLQIAFDLHGIAVSSGSACSSGKVGTSVVLQAMGVQDDKGAIRVSMGEATRKEDIDQFLTILKKILIREK